jgi:hypothetical protein
MEKIRQCLIVTIGLLLMGMQSFSQSNLPYTQGYADAVFLSIRESGTPILNSFEEAHTIPLVVSGFDFQFNGIYYHDFYVNPQGWVSLGSDATSQSLVSNNLTGLNQPILSPMWDMFNLLGRKEYIQSQWSDTFGKGGRVCKSFKPCKRCGCRWVCSLYWIFNFTSV